MVPQGSQAGHISQPLPSEEETAKNIDRLLFFSDAVFAIILTLTAIDLKLPAMCSSATAPGAGKDCWLDAWTMVGAARIPLVTYLSSFLIAPSSLQLRTRVAQPPFPNAPGSHPFHDQGY